MKKAIFIITLLAINVCTKSESIAQENVFKLRRSYREAPPKAILIQLFTHQRRLNYYKKTHENLKYQDALISSGRIMNKMVLDFNDNFDYCPVYYFYDSNSTQIRQQKFDGVLLNKNLQPAKDIIVHKGDTNYFIAYFGKMMPDKRGFTDLQSGGEVLMSSTGTNFYSGDRTAGLVLLNYKYEEIPRSVYRLTSRQGKRPKKPVTDYIYTSPKLNMIYRPTATVLHNTFANFYDI